VSPRRQFDAPRRLKRISAAAVALIAVIFGLPIGASKVWLLMRAPCQGVTLEQLPSPTGAWAAVLREDTCSVGWLGTNVNAVVGLVSAAHPSTGTDVLSVQTGRTDENPEPAWVSPDTLRITVCNLCDPLVLAQRLGEIKIDVQFRPDDPAARAAWLGHLAKLDRYRELRPVSERAQEADASDPWASDQAHCRDVELVRVPSPARQWSAVVSERRCGYWLFLTDVRDFVHVIASDDPILSARVVGIQTAGRAYEHPRPVWIAPDLLRVSLPGSTFENEVTVEVKQKEFASRDHDVPVSGLWLRHVAGETQ
jgi:hypothetical protein